jgi:hypothetical protein
MVIQYRSREGLDMTVVNDIVREELAPPEDWTDTPEQAQLRACVMGILSGHNCEDALGIGHALITLMRDQLSGGVANVRRKAALRARETMSPTQIAEASGQSRQTIARLLVEAKAS